MTGVMFYLFLMHSPEDLDINKINVWEKKKQLKILTLY